MVTNIRPQGVIGVIGTFSHSIGQTVNNLERRDQVIGKKVKLWVYIIKEWGGVFFPFGSALGIVR